MNDEGERKEPVGRCTAPSYRAEQDLYLKRKSQCKQTREEATKQGREQTSKGAPSLSAPSDPLKQFTPLSLGEGQGGEASYSFFLVNSDAKSSTTK